MALSRLLMPKVAAVDPFEKHILVDLDGTLAISLDDYSDPTVIGGPIPYMVQKVKAAIANGYVVKVFTARLADKAHAGRIKHAIAVWTKEWIGQALDSTNEKTPGAILILDDKAVGVKENAGEFKTAASPALAASVKIAEGYNEDGFWVGEGGGASGILPICESTKRICLAWRSAHEDEDNGYVDEPDCWGTIGGACKRGLSPAESAKEEMKEETGYSGSIQLHPAFVFTSGSFKYENFIGLVDSEFPFSPHSGHSWETDYIEWFTLDEIYAEMKKAPSEFHPGVLALFKNSKDLIEKLVGHQPGKTAAGRKHRTPSIKRKKSAAINIQPILTELMTVLKPGLPTPEVEIINRPSQKYLGQCMWRYGRDSAGPEPIGSGFVEGSHWCADNCTIFLQKKVMSDEPTLRRVLAHELCHHEDNLINMTAAFKRLGYPEFKAYYGDPKSFSSHGPKWQVIADRFNAKYGPDFVTKYSDTTYKTDGKKATESEAETKQAAARGIYYHGSPVTNLKSILSQGLQPAGDNRNYKSEEALNNADLSGPSIESYGGVYFTSNLMKAYGAPKDRRENVVIVAAELQPNTFALDEDHVVSMLSSALGGASFNENLVGSIYLALTNHAKGWDEIIDNYKTRYVLDFRGFIKKLFGSQGKTPHDRMLGRLNGLLQRTWVAALGRLAAQLFNNKRYGYSGVECYRKVFRDAKEVPPNQDIFPSVAEAESEFRAMAKPVTALLGSLAGPKSDGEKPNQNLRVDNPVGYSGSNRIVCVAQITTLRSSGTEIKIHWGKPPEDFIEQARSYLGNIRMVDVNGNPMEIPQKQAASTEVTAELVGSTPINLSHKFMGHETIVNITEDIFFIPYTNPKAKPGSGIHFSLVETSGTNGAKRFNVYRKAVMDIGRVTVAEPDASAFIRNGAIQAVYVTPEFRQSGLFGQLMREMAKRGLHVPEDNPKSQSFLDAEEKFKNKKTAAVPSLTLRHEVNDSHGGELFCHLDAYQGETKVGYVDYSIYEDEIHIKFIKTYPDFRKRGIATAMVQSLRDEYPGYPLDWGGLTDDGALLHEKVHKPSDERPNRMLTALEAGRDQLAEVAQEAYDSWDGFTDSYEDGQLASHIAEDLGYKCRELTGGWPEVSRMGRDSVVEITNHHGQTASVYLPSSLFEEKTAAGWVRKPEVKFKAEDLRIQTKTETQTAALSRTAIISNDLIYLRDYLTMSDRDQGEELARSHGSAFFDYIRDEFPDEEQFLPEDDEFIDDFTGFSDEALSGFRESEGNCLMHHDPSGAPTFLHMDYLGQVKNQWLVHFTDDPDSVARKGFTKGVDDYTMLGLTTYMHDDAKKSGGYNFAYLLSDFERYRGSHGGKYGKHAVIFKASGIKVFHFGDNEDQVIFKGSTAKDIVPVWYTDGEWELPEDKRGKPLFRSEKLGDVAVWVGQNWNQYKKVMTKRAAGNYPILVMTHPGSACGSADFNLGGGGTLSDAYRKGMIDQMNSWHGGFIVLSGAFDDDLRKPEYADFGSAITALLSRAKAEGMVSIRVRAHDPEHETVIKRLLKKSANQGSEYVCTGAWLYGDDGGCVGTTAEAIRSLGFKATVSDTAVSEWEDHDSDEEDSDGDDFDKQTKQANDKAPDTGLLKCREVFKEYVEKVFYDEECIGLRVQYGVEAKRTKVGDSLRPSSHWVDDAKTRRKMRGTACFYVSKLSDVDRIISYALDLKWLGGEGRWVVIGGDHLDRDADMPERGAAAIVGAKLLAIIPTCPQQKPQNITAKDKTAGSNTHRTPLQTDPEYVEETNGWALFPDQREGATGDVDLNKMID